MLSATAAFSAALSPASSYLLLPMTLGRQDLSGTVSVHLSSPRNGGFGSEGPGSGFPEAASQPFVVLKSSCMSGVAKG